MKLSQMLNEDAFPKGDDYIKVGDELNVIYVQGKSAKWRSDRWNATGGGDANERLDTKRRIMFIKNIEIEQDYEEKPIPDNPLDDIRDEFKGPDTIKCLIRGEAIYGHLDKGGTDGQLKSGYPWREFHGKFEVKMRTEICQTVKLFWSNPKPKRGSQLYLRDAQEIVGVIIEWIADRYNTNLRDFLHRDRGMRTRSY